MLNFRRSLAYPVTLGISELVVRLAAHDEWQFDALEPPEGVTLP